MPYLAGWHEKYKDKGLTIIGVHAPEFNFEREADNVRWALEHYGITYPVVLDNHFRIWHAYTNSYWPRKYLVLNGKIIYDHIGEGDYRETELLIRKYLQDISPELDLSDVPVVEELERICSMPTPETYLGFSRGHVNNPGGLQMMQEAVYKDPGVHQQPGLYLQGRWRSDRQYLEHVGSDAADYLVLPFKAVSVNLVITSSQPEPVRFSIQYNDQPLTDALKGDDVSESTVTVDKPQMYSLFRADKFATGTLKLTDLPDGLRLYAFSFGGCIGVT